MEQNRNRFAPEALADESASPEASEHSEAVPRSRSDANGRPTGRAASPIDVTGQLSRDGPSDQRDNANDNVPSGIAFDPVPVRQRIDGITPAKQREFVEVLADTGLVNVAAARIGVSEQSIARLRRRADARSFDLACHAARRIGARRLHALAWERAIEGTVKRHHYHGELVSEERVFDNRLLVYLLGKTEHLLDEPEEAPAIVANWEPYVEAMEQGTPLPDIRPEWERGEEERLAEYALEEELEGEDEDNVEASEDELWWEGDGWLTSFPPPAGFDGIEDGVPGDPDYRRTLTGAEEKALEAGAEAEEQERMAKVIGQARRRDAHFGFAAGLSEELVEEMEGEGFFFPMEAEPSEPLPERGAQQSSAPVASGHANGRPACGEADRTDVTDNGP